MPRLGASRGGVSSGASPPGGEIEILVPFTVPALADTYAAYWQVVDALGQQCFARSQALRGAVVAP